MANLPDFLDNSLDISYSLSPNYNIDELIEEMRIVILKSNLVKSELLEQEEKLPISNYLIRTDSE